MGYTPVFDSIYTGTLYGRWPSAAVWASLLPLVDRHGDLNLSFEAIHGMTGWPMDLLRVGIQQLCEPDPASRTQEHEGRRLIPLDPERPWGWRVVNHARYREKARKAAYDAARVEDGRNAERLRQRRAAQAEDLQDPTRPDATRADPLSDSNSNSDSDKRKRKGSGETNAHKPEPSSSQDFSLEVPQDAQDGRSPSTLPGIAVSGRSARGGPINARAGHSVPEVEGLDAVAWVEWEHYRAGIGKRIKPVSRDAMARKLAGFGADQLAVVRQSREQQWTGLFPLKLEPASRSTLAEGRRRFLSGGT